MGHGLDLHAIADIPGPSLGENMFVREAECEQCLMALFPSVLRPPRGGVSSPALAWTIHGDRMKFDAGRQSHVLVQEAGMTARMFEHSRMGEQGGYLSASGVGALGYGLSDRGMRGHDSVRVDHIQTGVQRVWTRPIEPIVLTETTIDYSSGLLPPIELDRRRVGAIHSFETCGRMRGRAAAGNGKKEVMGAHGAMSDGRT
ncbi:hypothetical protein FRC06_006332 [Ceratobasidium sp. 370]|nr:hypothetical protein FRC06_006332 [Ceratobasidium sp. 370]